MPTAATRHDSASDAEHADHSHHHHSGGGTTLKSKGDGDLTFRVDGMSCASCAATVQRAIESRPGVEQASVSVIDGRAVVKGHDLDADEIARVITDKGYPAQPLDDRPALSELRSEIEQRQIEHERLWKRRAIIGLSIWAPLESLHWIAVAAGWHSAVGAHGVGWMDWLSFAGSTIVMIAAGGGFYRSAWNAAKRRTTNMDTLIAIGATAAYAFSLVVFIARLFGHMHEQPLYFAEAAALLGLISLGHWLEARATAKAGSAVRELLELQPDHAERIDDSGEVTSIRSADVEPGDRLLIRPGARVPVDGGVVEGEGDVDESIVTGESAPVAKQPGSDVVAGSVNTTGRLVIEARVDGRHTTVSRIAEMVQQAQSSKADIQRLADSVAAIFVPTVLLIALVTIAGWTIYGDFSRGIIAMCTVLIISCPCALGLATPMAVMVGAGAASKRGILVKSASALESAGRASLVIFDKTGTLTVGQPRVIEIAPADSTGEDELLRWAAAVESPSEHPIARAITHEARSRKLSIPQVSEFKSITGKGVRGMVDGKSIEVIRDEQATCRVSVDGRSIGTITVADEPREDAKKAIERLREMNIECRMLSGDRAHAAKAVGERIGLAADRVMAEASPEQKVDRVREAADRSESGTVVMVGDGINDAAALAAADLGVAMASGTNIAIESADIVIPSERVTSVADAIDIARQTLRTIKQNLFFAFFYNAAAIPAAALGLLGPYGPLIAAAAMGFSDITVIGNALRLKARLSRS